LSENKFHIFAIFQSVSPQFWRLNSRNQINHGNNHYSVGKRKDFFSGVFFLNLKQSLLRPSFSIRPALPAGNFFQEMGFSPVLIRKEILRKFMLQMRSRAPCPVSQIMLFKQIQIFNFHSVFLCKIISSLFCPLHGRRNNNFRFNLPAQSQFLCLRPSKRSKRNVPARAV